MRVVVDCGHGAAGVSSPQAFQQLGADVIALNCEWTGDDINVGCGSTDLGQLREAVAEHGADIGLAHDGDADRVLAVDETGSEVDGDEIMAILAADLKQRGRLTGDLLVVTVMSNLGLELAMRDNGIQVVKTRVGDRYVLDGMRAQGASLGGEQSGHIIFLDKGTTGDGLMTAVLLCATIRDSGLPLSELRSIMRRYPQVLVNVPVRDKGRLATSAAITNAIHAEESRLGDRGRVLVRPSGTEPLVRVMAEAETADDAQETVDALVAIIGAELG
jgi:phosphoglucosamine mutase